MSRVSLPGLFLSAVVVVAALLALLALEFDGSAPGQYQSPPESDAIMRLSEARGAVKGRSDSSAAQRRSADRRASARRRNSARTRRGSARRNGAGLGRGRSRGSTPVAAPPSTPPD